MKFPVEIKNRWTDAVILSRKVEAETEATAKRIVLVQAVAEGANLRGANLVGADMEGANLVGADLGDADLVGAYLDGAYLDGANLRGAKLRGIRDDVWAILSCAPTEVPALRRAILDGRINGSTYRDDSGCGCLAGTLEIARGGGEKCIPALRHDSDRPAERFFLAIKKGDTPDTNQASRIALEWVDEWMASVRAGVVSWPVVEASKTHHRHQKGPVRSERQV